MPDQVIPQSGLNVLRKYVLPIVLGVAGAYTGVAVSMGSWQQRIVELEKQTTELRKDNEQLRQHIYNDEPQNYVTNREFKNYVDSQNDTLKQIRIDVKDWQRGR